MSNQEAAPRPSVGELVRQRLGSGSPFELAEEIILGESMDVFETRASSLRTLLQRSAQYGEPRLLAGRLHLESRLRDRIIRGGENPLIED